MLLDDSRDEAMHQVVSVFSERLQRLQQKLDVKLAAVEARMFNIENAHAGQREAGRTTQES